MNEAAAALDLLPPGVGETPVESLEESGVRCFYSQIDRPAAGAEAFRADALRFHSIVQEILARTSVVPFAFPTLIETDKPVREYLRVHASTLLQDLHRLRGLVQMEVRIRRGPAGDDAKSGTEYLRGRLEEKRALSDLAARAFAAAEKLIQQWMVRSDGSGLRCYALVLKDGVVAFQRSMQSLSPLQGATMIVSGPWPPAEFLNVPAL